MPVLPDAPVRENVPEPKDGPLLTPTEWGLVAAGAVVSLAAVWLTTRYARREDPGRPWLPPIGDEMHARGDVVSLIRDAVVGVSRRGVRRQLGEPRAAGRDGFLVDQPGSGQRQAADVWYYQAGDDPRTAVAVRFDGDKAVDAKVFRAPGDPD